MATPEPPSAPDETTHPSDVPPSTKRPGLGVGLAPGRTFTERWRRIWRRQPDMSNVPVDLNHAFGLGLACLIPGAIIGIVLALLMPSNPPVIVLLLTVSPYLQVHVEGVRHRWWALGAGAAAGVLAGFGIDALLKPSFGSDWGHLIGLLAGGWLGVMTHAAVTHLPTRGMQPPLP